MHFNFFRVNQLNKLMSTKLTQKKVDPLKVCVSMWKFEQLISDVLNLLWRRLKIGWVNKMFRQFLNPELTNVQVNIIEFI